MSKSFFLFIFSLLSVACFSQDKIVLINGKQIIGKNIGLGGNSISYNTVKGKTKKMHTDRAFSIQYANGSEKVIYTADPLDPSDFSVEEMRMFIKGEQEASLYYTNYFHTGLALTIGQAASAFAIYGLILPPLYATIVGGHSPDMEKMKVSDPGNLYNSSFKEGYLKKVRERKIRNGLLGGFIGFVAGFTIIAITQNN